MEQSDKRLLKYNSTHELKSIWEKPSNICKLSNPPRHIVIQQIMKISHEFEAHTSAHVMVCLSYLLKCELNFTPKKQRMS